MTENDDLEFTTEIDAAVVEAIGEPGQRRFRLIALSNGETTILWMEKQQLDALGQALTKIIDQIDVEASDFEQPGAGSPIDLNTTHQFRVGRLEIGFDRERGRVLVVAYDIESDEADGPSLAGLFSVSLAQDLAEEADKVVSAGRPRCVLCGLPMGPGPHACAQQNGHLANYA